MATDSSFATTRICATPATVLGITEQGGIVLDRTVFYATSGGQPGDRGVLVTPACEISARDRRLHRPAQGRDRPRAGRRHQRQAGPSEKVTLKLDWEPRYRRMRMHTGLHLLSAVRHIR